MYAETWLNAASKLPSFCSGVYKVENVENITCDGVLSFKYTKDHSKWTISEHKKWTCIGDINRTKFHIYMMTGKTTVCVMLVVLATGLPGRDGKITCMDPSGNPVDWFIVYKLPCDSKSSDPLIKEGVAHMYMDVNSQSFSRSTVSLKDTNQAVARTLQQIYKNHKSQDVVYVLYNDEFPNGTVSLDKGHTKGDIAFDHESGFWLIHSVPKFPNSSDQSYVWPSNAVWFGQSMLCISMKTLEFVKVAHQLLYNNPWVYDANIPQSFKAKFEDLVSVTEGHHVESAPWNSSVVLTSAGGQAFTSYAKFVNFGEDLYSHWVAPALGDDMYAETWRKAATKLPSFCTGVYKVENVENITFDGVLSFEYTKDHSKWAISEHEKWTCIGDINRNESQFKRGGGTVCFKIPAVWTAFNTLIANFSRCPASLSHS
ncbi:plancitoxin-1-like [Diadema setosum]|uniref:plancitoxin-1-like n=1 Tax=Diadema setosum TaxID=31175 RepID=UPI003B3BC233